MTLVVLSVRGVLSILDSIQFGSQPNDEVSLHEVQVGFSNGSKPNLLVMGELQPLAKHFVPLLFNRVLPQARAKISGLAHVDPAQGSRQAVHLGGFGVRIYARHRGCGTFGCACASKLMPGQLRSASNFAHAERLTRFKTDVKFHKT